TCGNPDDAAALIDHILRPETQAALQNTQAAAVEAAPDPEEVPPGAQWAQIRDESALYTSQGPAVPDGVAGSYFALQSDVLQGNPAPAEAARDTQQIVADGRESQGARRASAARGLTAAPSPPCRSPRRRW